MSSLQLFLEDNDLNIQYTPPTAWADNSSALWTGGNSKIPRQFPGATLQYTFNGEILRDTLNQWQVSVSDIGTSAAFHGAALNNSMFTPIIDNLPQASQSLPSSNPPSYGVWYQTPDLPPGEHTVIIHDIPAVTLDFIVLEVDPSTTFSPTSSILVSDSDPSIKYSGNWNKDFSRFQTLRPFTFIGDYSTRSSCNPGDSFSLPFSGSSITLWGVFDWGSTGHVTVAYSVDGNQLAEQDYQADDTSQNRFFGVQTNFHLFTAPNLSNGPHNLVVNITSCTNQRFSLDYLTYTPSFTSGQDAPNPSSINTGQTLKSSEFPKGAIAGIVVGAVVLVAAGVTLWFYIARRRRATEPFPRSSPSDIVARKEQVPAHMRHLGSQPSRGTIRTNTIDITDGSSSHENRYLVFDSSDGRNTHDAVAQDQPPPAYPNLSPLRDNGIHGSVGGRS